MQQDDSQGGAVPEDAPKVDERSGATVEAAVEVAAAGSEHGGVERRPSSAESGESPVEETRGDSAMTGGQVVTGPGTPDGPDPAPPSTPPQEASESGGAQSMPGARPSDRIAGQPD